MTILRLTKITKVEKGVTGKYRLTIEADYFSWFRLQKREIQVEGSSTVWYYYPEGNRVPLGSECRIRELIKAFEMQCGKKLCGGILR